MRMIIVISLAACLCLQCYGQQPIPLRGTISGTIAGLRSSNGYVKIALFHSKEGFPDNPEKALKKQIRGIDSLSCHMSFNNIEYGEYAIGIFHDENGNGEMDTGLFGIPKEGYGASNDAKGFMGPPKYRDAKFTLRSDTLHMKITMNY
jgi:uncharacterized protein (DUF2141 family)